MPRYPLVRQNDESDCGVAALATVAMFYRMRLSLEKLRDLSGTDLIGTSMLGLLEAAERVGFDAKGFHGQFDALPEITLPAIVHIRTDDNSGHFAVLYRVGKRGVILADPARTQVEKLSAEEFCKRWSGYVLQLIPQQPVKGVEVAGATGTFSKRLLRLLKGHRPVLSEAFGCAVLMTLLGVVNSYFIQHLVDSVLVHGETHLLNALGIGMLVIVVMRVLFGLVRHYLLAYVARKVDLSLIGTYTRHILRLPVRFFETRHMGDILSRTQDAESIREAISGTALAAVVDATLVFLSFGILWLYDWPLAFMATAFAPLLVISVIVHHPASRRMSRDVMERDARFYSHLAENVYGIETIKAFGAERDRLEENDSRLVKVTESTFGLEKVDMSMSTLTSAVVGIAGISILWFGGHRVISGALSIGQLLFFYSMLTYLLGPLERLSLINLDIQEASVALDRLYQFLDLEEEKLTGDDKSAFDGLDHSIVLDDLTFRYGRRGDVLDRIHLEIPAGKTVAILGESGSGKSTLLKLLMGLYLPSEGHLLIDGVDIQEIDLASLRRRVALVSQEPYIFSGSIHENIAFGQRTATLRQIREAAKTAGLEQFIESLPDRYETLIGERGTNLSGGQRQRLAIARALLREPDVLLFDEATSHLDSATEKAIQQSLKETLDGKTVILVAHRLSTVKHADRIYVLDQGRVKEQGSHAELMESQGWYASLWKTQYETTTSERGDTEKNPLLAKRNGTNHSRKQWTTTQSERND